VSTGIWRDGVFYGPDRIQSVVTNIDQAVDGHYPALVMPGDGYVVSAYVIADVDASGTNLIEAGLINGGADGAGTIITAAQVGGGGFLAGSAYALTIDNTGPEAYAEGEICMVNLSTDNAATDVSVQVNYVLKPPGAES
jgi:hypothetical protein